MKFQRFSFSLLLQLKSGTKRDTKDRPRTTVPPPQRLGRERPIRHVRQVLEVSYVQNTSILRFTQGFY